MNKYEKINTGKLLERIEELEGEVNKIKRSRIRESLKRMSLKWLVVPLVLMPLLIFGNTLSVTDFVDGTTISADVFRTRFNEIEEAVNGNDTLISGLDSNISDVSSDVSSIQSDITNLDSNLGGIAYSTVSGNISNYISSVTGDETVVSAELLPPADGFIIASYSGCCMFIGVNDNSNYLSFMLTDSESTSVVNNDTSSRLIQPGKSDGTDFTTSVASHKIFPVTANTAIEIFSNYRVLWRSYLNRELHYYTV